MATVAASGAAFFGHREGVLSLGPLRDAEGWRMPIEVDFTPIQQKIPTAQERDQAEAARIAALPTASVAEVAIMASGLVAKEGIVCPDSVADPDALPLGEGKSARLLCWDPRATRVVESSGRVWMQLMAAVPVLEGELPIDLKETFDVARAEQCAAAARAVLALANPVIKTADPRHNDAVRYDLQVVISAVPSACDQPPLVAEPVIPERVG